MQNMVVRARMTNLNVNLNMNDAADVFGVVDDRCVESVRCVAGYAP